MAAAEKTTTETETSALSAFCDFLGDKERACLTRIDEINRQIRQLDNAGWAGTISWEESSGKNADLQNDLARAYNDRDAAVAALVLAKEFMEA